MAALISAVHLRQYGYQFSKRPGECGTRRALPSSFFRLGSTRPIACSASCRAHCSERLLLPGADRLRMRGVPFCRWYRRNGIIIPETSPTAYSAHLKGSKAVGSAGSTTDNGFRAIENIVVYIEYNS